MGTSEETSKQCKSCEETKTLSEFHRDKAQRDGHCYVCKECNKRKARSWYAANPDKATAARKKHYQANRKRYRARSAAYRKQNREAISRMEKAWREANADRKRENDRRWQRGNPEKVRQFRRVSEQTRRAKKKASQGQYTADDVKCLYERQNGLCACCGKSLRTGYHIDHITPLSKGGDNSIRNIQLLCPRCNLKKSNKDPIQFMQEMGFLL